MSYLNDKEASLFSVTSLLMTDVGDQICWCRVWDASDKSLHQHQELGTSIFGLQHPSPLVTHQHRCDRKYRGLYVFQIGVKNQQSQKILKIFKTETNKENDRFEKNGLDHRNLQIFK